MSKGPYRTPADILRSATDIVDKLATIRAEIATNVGSFYVESYGKDVCELIDEITRRDRSGDVGRVRPRHGEVRAVQFRS
jgi:hypothetical protein